ncbi:MAG: filamentous hemagglutinin N-terminal domain-containing protein [Synechococcales cyanobacterium CRU_2_2]|nr:filamentous hemagglutinin N-terminal domain-containing protein [Synechococcales cyanobacterium CRU_2_2]
MALSVKVALWAVVATWGLGLELARIPASAVLAQTVPDGLLGTENSVVTRQGDRDLVSGGATRGSRLFHSLLELNVGEGRSLFFVNPEGIAQILGRVTGDKPSDIFGTLGVLGDADLFLLNPNGILFGPNAQLAIAGSFLASTGDRFTFADGTSFSAVNPEPNALLTISVPTGLQLGANPGAIVNRSRANGVGLAIAPGQTLALVGGEISLDGGQSRRILGGLNSSRFRIKPWNCAQMIKD